MPSILSPARVAIIRSTTMKRIMKSLKQFYTDLYLQLNAVKIALITGSMTLLVPVSASAQEGLGETV